LRPRRGFDTLIGESRDMRQFLWGVAFGALTVYLYANYGATFYQFRRYTLSWRDWAVRQTGHYSAGHHEN
jgi:hypothetical protein